MFLRVSQNFIIIYSVVPAAWFSHSITHCRHFSVDNKGKQFFSDVTNEILFFFLQSYPSVNIYKSVSWSNSRTDRHKETVDKIVE